MDPSADVLCQLARWAAYLAVLLTSLWAVMALAIDLPFPRLRIVAAVVYGLAVVFILYRLRFVVRDLWSDGSGT